MSKIIITYQTKFIMNDNIRVAMLYHGCIVPRVHRIHAELNSQPKTEGNISFISIMKYLYLVAVDHNKLRTMASETI